MKVAVLGAGIQGACTALELARRGVEVDLYDRAEQAINGASLYNEGKIHLGYVYGNDPSLRTATLMARGAVTFAPLMRRWIGDALDTTPTCSPFLYLVHRDSIVSPEDSHAFFDRVHALGREELRGAKADYFGQTLLTAPSRVAAETIGISDENVAAVFQTEEVAIDPEAIARLMRDAISSEPKIRPCFSHLVDRVERDGSTLIVTSSSSDGAKRASYDHVVNALWDGRLAIDEQLGLRPERRWLFRYKEFLRCQPSKPVSVPSATIVLGAFGDIVNYGNGELYLSWYPAGLRNSNSDLAPPDKSEVTKDRDAAATKRAMVRALATFAPDLEDLNDRDIETSSLGGGWIFGWGKTDIDDPNSGLHERYEVGVSSGGGYHTIDTGKYTTAPLFAMRAADAICAT